jgi:hypothetical protein
MLKDGVCPPVSAQAPFVREVSAVSRAAMVFSKRAFEAVGGFDESKNIDELDVDFCLRLARAGFRTLFTPAAEVRLTQAPPVSRNLSASARDPYIPANKKAIPPEELVMPYLFQSER